MKLDGLEILSVRSIHRKNFTVKSKKIVDIEILSRKISEIKNLRLSSETHSINNTNSRLLIFKIGVISFPILRPQAQHNMGPKSSKLGPEMMMECGLNNWASTFIGRKGVVHK